MCLAAAPAVGNVNIGGGNPLVGILVVADAEQVSADKNAAVIIQVILHLCLQVIFRLEL